MMERQELKKAGLRGLARRREIEASPQDLVAMYPAEVSNGDGLPLLAKPRIEGVDLIAWAAGHRDLIGQKVLDHGGVLFRGFGLSTAEELQDLVKALCGELLEYTYRSTPRTRVRGEIYTSTEYPADQSIPLHNEMSYSPQWPLKIFFLCATPARSGGETPIADSRRVFRQIDPEVRERFARKGVMYVRNYGEGIDLSWQEVFQTDDRKVVDEFCREHGLEREWWGRDSLRTRQTCQGVAMHPRTGEAVWFNQAHLFHISSLSATVRESLLAVMGEEDLPRNAFYGDGTPIEEEVLQDIRRIYDQESIVFPWCEGDVLVLDNMLTAHGRRPFTAPRRVLVGMAEPWSAA